MDGAIRPATELDIPRLLELEQLFDNAMTEPMLARELSAGSGGVFFSPQTGTVLGYVLLRYDQGLLDITRLGVDPAAQGQGIGPRLLEYALSEGHEAMLTVRKNNKRALRLYLKYGFKIAGHITVSDAWVLRRPAPSLGDQATG